MSDRKAYLMTLADYLVEVAPVLKEYKTFLKKNKYFIHTGYGGMGMISYPEARELMEKEGRLDEGVWFNFQKNGMVLPNYSWIMNGIRLMLVLGIMTFKRMPRKRLSPKRKNTKINLSDFMANSFLTVLLGMRTT